VNNWQLEKVLHHCLCWLGDISLCHSSSVQSRISLQDDMTADGAGERSIPLLFQNTSVQIALF